MHDPSFQAIVVDHMARYPAAELDDLYKLVFQAAMGSEHAAADLGQATRRLVDEADALSTPYPDDSIMMPISPDHRLVRVHIGPFREAGGDLNVLARAFAATASRFSPSVEHLSTYWFMVEKMSADGTLAFPPSLVQQYGDRRRSEGFPAVHHSPRFRRVYRPAYRVVLKELVDLPPISTPHV